MRLKNVFLFVKERGKPNDQVKSLLQTITKFTSTKCGFMGLVPVKNTLVSLILKKLSRYNFSTR